MRDPTIKMTQRNVFCYCHKKQYENVMPVTLPYTTWIQTAHQGSSSQPPLNMLNIISKSNYGKYFI